jgi:hypothetical protein
LALGHAAPGGGAPRCSDERSRAQHIGQDGELVARPLVSSFIPARVFIKARLLT